MIRSSILIVCSHYSLDEYDVEMDGDGALELI